MTSLGCGEACLSSMVTCDTANRSYYLCSEVYSLSQTMPVLNSFGKEEMSEQSLTEAMQHHSTGNICNS